MPVNSRAKGARFERRIASAFSSAFDRKIRRVPASGGLDIRCDLYDPENDNFRYYIECKYRESYRFETLISGTSPLYKVLKNTEKLCNESYLQHKYKIGPVPMVIFKGGEFKIEWVMISHTNLNRTLFPEAQGDSEFVVAVFANSTMFMPFTVFLEECLKDNLIANSYKNLITHDEDDGTPD